MQSPELRREWSFEARLRNRLTGVWATVLALPVLLLLVRTGPTPAEAVVREEATAVPLGPWGEEDPLGELRHLQTRWLSVFETATDLGVELEPVQFPELSKDRFLATQQLMKTDLAIREREIRVEAARQALERDRGMAAPEGGAP